MTNPLLDTTVIDRVPAEFLAEGARIDVRTTVYNLGRAAAVLLSDGTLDRAPFRGTDRQHGAVLRACREDPAARFAGVAELQEAFRA